MTFDDLSLSELPTNTDFSRLIDQRFYLWESYKPTTIEADIPFDQDWWKYIYWIPRIKKEFYLLALSSLNFDKDLIEICNKYGIDHWFFTTHYDFLIKRMKWMRKQKVTHIGEVKV